MSYSDPQITYSPFFLVQQRVLQSNCYEFFFPPRIVLMIPNSIIINLLPWEVGSVVSVPRGSVQGTSASIFGRRKKLL